MRALAHIDPAVLAAHAEFGGDLEDMQRRYESATVEDVNDAQFEVFETGEHFLLHFPRDRREPSELFTSLADAKARAEEAVKE